ncbi:hypothetical protein CR513_47264, partial [Mucuna pruriens]
MEKGIKAKISNMRLKNKITKLNSLVGQLAIGQHQSSPLARVCGICPSMEHPTNACLTLQEIELNAAEVAIMMGKCNFDAMLDLGTSINVIPSSVYKSLRLDALESISIVIQLENKSITQPLGILEDMLMQVNDMIFLVDFYVLDMKDELSSKGPTLVLGRPFLKTTRTKIDVHVGTLFMEFGDNRVEYIIFEAMKHPIKNHLVFYLDVIDLLGDDYMDLHSEFPNFDDFKDCDCTCTELTECPICLEISNVINVFLILLGVQKFKPYLKLQTSKLDNLGSLGKLRQRSTTFFMVQLNSSPDYGTLAANSSANPIFLGTFDHVIISSLVCGEL